MMYWNFKKAGINCYVTRKDNGEYKITIYQKGKMNRYNQITLWLPDDESFDFIVKQMFEIQWDIWNEFVKKELKALKNEK